MINFCPALYAAAAPVFFFENVKKKVDKVTNKSLLSK